MVADVCTWNYINQKKHAKPFIAIGKWEWDYDLSNDFEQTMETAPGVLKKVFLFEVLNE